MEKVHAHFSEDEINRYAKSFRVRDEMGWMSMILQPEIEIHFSTHPNKYTILQVDEPSDGGIRPREATYEELFLFVTVAKRKAPDSEMTNALYELAKMKLQTIEASLGQQAFLLKQQSENVRRLWQDM